VGHPGLLGPRWIFAPGALRSDLLVCVLERGLGARPPWSQRLALAGGATIYAMSILAATQFWAGDSSSSSSTGLLTSSTTPSVQIYITILPTFQSTFVSACQSAVALAISLLLTGALILTRLLSASTLELGIIGIAMTIIFRG